MRENEVEELTAEIVRLRDVDPDIADDVIEEFHHLVSARRYAGQGGLAFAQELLEASVGGERAKELIARLAAAMSELPFHFLHRADPRQILSFVQDEHPQTIALVLAHVRADQASMILSGLAPELQADVAHRIAVMDRTSPEIIRQVESMLERKLSSVLASPGSRYSSSAPSSWSSGIRSGGSRSSKRIAPWGTIRYVRPSNLISTEAFRRKIA